MISRACGNPAFAMWQDWAAEEGHEHVISSSPKMINWIEIRTFCRRVDKMNVVRCQQVLSGPGCMTRGSVLDQSHAAVHADVWNQVR